MTLDNTFYNSSNRKHQVEERYNKILEQISSTHTFYNYSKSIYTGIDNTIIIICPIHGEFEQTSYAHFGVRSSKCPTCAKQLGTSKRKSTLENFIIQAKKIHNNKYDYSLVEYKNTNTKVSIICPIHGKFTQQPADHISGHGCFKCGHTETGGILTTAQFVEKATKVHGIRYSYSKSVYIRSKFKLIITCPYHGDFVQTASDHLNGNGCQTCGQNRKRAKYFSKPTILYYVYFPAFNAYKIGITLESRGISKRFNTEKGLTYKIITSTIYSTGKEAFEQEQKILKEHSQHRYSGPKFLNKGGESECFNINVLGISKDEDIVESA